MKNNKKGKHSNPIKSLFQVENFLQKITCAKKTCNFVCSAKEFLNKKFTNPH